MISQIFYKILLNQLFNNLMEHGKCGVNITPNEHIKLSCSTNIIYIL